MNDIIQKLTVYFKSFPFSILEINEKDKENPFVVYEDNNFAIDWLKGCDKEQRFLDFPQGREGSGLYFLFFHLDYNSEKPFRENASKELYNDLIIWVAGILKNNPVPNQVKDLFAYALEDFDRLSNESREAVKTLVSSCSDSFEDIDFLEDTIYGYLDEGFVENSLKIISHCLSIKILGGGSLLPKIFFLNEPQGINSRLIFGELENSSFGETRAKLRIITDCLKNIFEDYDEEIVDRFVRFHLYEFMSGRYSQRF